MFCRVQPSIFQSRSRWFRTEAHGTHKISDGIYFDTSKFCLWGTVDNVLKKEPGARVVNEEKTSVRFCSRKFSPSVETGVVRQMEWESPGDRVPGLAH